MDTADSQHLSRISKTLLAAVGVSFAWILLSIALGFSASHAHADEDPGLLGSVTGIVEDTASGATVLAQDATAPVGETAVQAVETASLLLRRGLSAEQLVKESHVHSFSGLGQSSRGPVQSNDPRPVGFPVNSQQRYSRRRTASIATSSS